MQSFASRARSSGLRAVRHLLDRRQAQRQHLRVAFDGVHRPKARVEVPHRRQVRPALQPAQEVERRSAGHGQEAIQALAAE